jgi:hypothetical protein
MRGQLAAATLQASLESDEGVKIPIDGFAAGVTKMAVIEIRITDMVDTDRIDLGVTSGITYAPMNPEQKASTPDPSAVLVRPAQPVPLRTPAPRQAKFTMDYPDWHSRLAGSTGTA